MSLVKSEEFERVKKEVENEIANFSIVLRTRGPLAINLLLSALFFWLFGNLVFIPLAGSINQETRSFVTLIFFIIFSILIVSAIPGIKVLLDSFSVFPARKYGLKKGLNLQESVILTRYIFYVVASIILYLLYYPFLNNFHPAISGLLLIIVLVWIFFVLYGITSILTRNIVEWMHPKKTR